MMNRTSGTPAAAQQPAEGSNGEGEANGATTDEDLENEDGGYNPFDEGSTTDEDGATDDVLYCASHCPNCTPTCIVNNGIIEEKRHKCTVCNNYIHGGACTESEEPSPVCFSCSSKNPRDDGGARAKTVEIDNVDEDKKGEGETNAATTEYYRAFVPKVTSKFSFNIS